MKILVTGASGFLGKQLVINLLDRGHKVFALSRTNLNFNNNNFTLINCDLKLLATIKEINGIDAVLHCAANINFSQDFHILKEMIFDNVESTYSLLEFMKMNDINKLIYSSSSSVYAENFDSQITISENFPILPKNNYAITKLTAEHLINNFCKSNNIEYVNLRYSSIYGYGQIPTSILPIFIKNALNGETLKIFGFGNRTQDYVFIEDIVKVNIYIIENNKFSKQIINIGSGEFMTDLQLANLILEVTKSKSKIEIHNKSIDDPFFTYNITLARTYLNFQPTELKIGLTYLISNYI